MSDLENKLAEKKELLKEEVGEEIAKVKRSLRDVTVDDCRSVAREALK